MLQFIWLSIFRGFSLNHLHPHTGPAVLCNCQLEPLGSATVPAAGCSDASSRSSPSSLKTRDLSSQGLLSQTSFHTDEETEVQKQPRVTTKVRIQKFMLSPQFATLKTLVYIQVSLLWDGTRVASEEYAVGGTHTGRKGVSARKEGLNSGAMAYPGAFTHIH